MQLREHLHAGAHANPAAHAAAVEQLVVPPELEFDRLRIIAWLLAMSGDYSLARDRFLASADLAKEGGYLYAAMRAYRSADWAMRRQPSFTLVDRAEIRAIKLEPLVEASEVRRTTQERMMRRIDALLRHRDLRSAFIAVRAAYILAWQDVDPAAVESVNLRIASVWASGCCR